MPINSNLVGKSAEPVEHRVDARELMAYAAGISDFNPCYFDTDKMTVLAHPMYSVCLEWPLVSNQAEVAGMEEFTAEERLRAVHAAHDIHFLRPIKAGDRLQTHSTMAALDPIKPGALAVSRLDTLDANTGELVLRTYQSGVFRGVDIIGETTSSEEIPPWPQFCDPSMDGIEKTIAVSAGAAHVYTECTNIWNPIHTDKAVALASGLPDLILHGTATLSMAVSSIIDEFADADPTRVTRLGGRFTGMVYMPSILTLQAIKHGNVVSFQVKSEEGGVAISNGFVCLTAGK
ncbi:hypothetical protein HBA55_22610 [Pseudomaricurvus alkylphenolicus]|uniref:MaoC/PaaZ C-terminal domain-containing protein n=1 Tax=Pseudomaricurvus alkylphenolicus TaxID=1306991 RepID=UPI00141E8756|nr:MaoC/PaaZ C-terminal domain-containing protein [Pseudomaricurvus alkylphenolicus]NIB42416.1 hypothetical protein [Pseudomaricurvus alkylphenolicus]